jgi:hypothetical protein
MFLTLRFAPQAFVSVFNIYQAGDITLGQIVFCANVLDIPDSLDYGISALFHKSLAPQ